MVNIYFYKTSSEREVIPDFINDLDDITRARVRNAINLLREYELTLLRTKWVKKVHQHPSIFELRITGSKQVRLLFIVYEQNAFLILHIFIKKSQKIPQREINMALKRALEFI